MSSPPPLASETSSRNTASSPPVLQGKSKSSAAASTPFKPLSTGNKNASARSTDLPTKISQLKTTIEHTQTQLIDTLDKLAALPSSEQDTTTTTTPATSIPATRIVSATATASGTTSLTPSRQNALSEAQSVLDGHIKLLSQYNELKDAGMVMLRLIAEREGRVVRDVMVERGVGEDD